MTDKGKPVVKVTRRRFLLCGAAGEKFCVVLDIAVGGENVLPAVVVEVPDGNPFGVEGRVAALLGHFGEHGLRHPRAG